MNSALRRIGIAASIATLAMGAGTSTAMGADGPDFTVDFPAGVACAGFAVRVEGSGGNQHTREFRDAEGQLVRMITAGTKPGLTLINMSTGASLDIKSDGSVQHTTFHSDGTQTVRSTGHTVVVWFPTDVPAGPSMTLYMGQIVFTIDSDGVGTMQSVRGTSTDICAALRS